jgi:two-component system, NtrC family, nitrogen regulation sensor histidine kinase NtrY
MKTLMGKPRLIPLQNQLFVLGVMPVIPVVLFCWLDRRFGPFSEALLVLVVSIFAAGMLFHYYLLWRLCNDPFRTLANLVRSLHQGDFSQRAVSFPEGDALGTLHDEINHLADVLQNNRFAAVEATKRFQYLIDQLEIAVVAFDEHRNLVLANHSFARLFGKLPWQIQGMGIGVLHLEALWGCESGRALWLNFPEKSSRYVVHCSALREEGRPQHLFLLTDVKHPLREEERTAWRRLIRVLGHELNNSLTPITSLAQSLRQRVHHSPMPEDWKSSSEEALDIIVQRAKSMNRFVEDYSRLAKLPEPVRESMDLATLVPRTAQMLAHPAITLEDSPSMHVEVDPGQIEQLLINVVRNALDAIPEESGQVTIRWRRESTDAVIEVEDNGPGIEREENLFVPFFSTKPGGSGIGLVLSLQIAEANGGSLHLGNRLEGGCRVSLTLPISQF